MIGVLEARRGSQLWPMGWLLLTGTHSVLTPSTTENWLEVQALNTALNALPMRPGSHAMLSTGKALSLSLRHTSHAYAAVQGPVHSVPTVSNPNTWAGNRSTAALILMRVEVKHAPSAMPAPIHDACNQACYLQYAGIRTRGRLWFGPSTLCPSPLHNAYTLLLLFQFSCCDRCRSCRCRCKHRACTHGSHALPSAL